MRINRPKETHTARKRLARQTLIGWGIPEKLIKKIISSPHKLEDVEKLIQAAEKRRPKEPAEYFLKGFDHYRVKGGRSPLHLYRSLTKEKGVNRK